MDQLIGLIPLLPLISFIIIGLFGKKLPHSMINILACGSVLVSFLISCYIFSNINHEHHSFEYNIFNWINSGELHIGFSLLVDPLSSLFLLIITGVGFLIHVYSTGYMHDDEGYHRFFAYLNLFIFFMLLLVMGSNYVMMFVGWEGVGLCSYLLIGFWFKNIEYSNAAKKAFVMNRIGDLGFLLGISLMFVTYNSVSFNEVFPKAITLGSSYTIVLMTIFLFIGAVGKSAQIPLFTWLPDAMAGPTPVSALIHAATMVTAGIYMIARSNVLFSLAPLTMDIVASVGLATALFAATIGMFQNDIKKVLAYSTVSQLGLMFLALGVGAYTAGVFHVITHAFFKALLFLGAGSVIHAMSGEQDIRKMGGLKKYLPTTYLTFLIGTIAISGIPPLAGFFSKDQILAGTFHTNKLYFIFGLIVSMITCFYMFRLLYLTFFGNFRGNDHQMKHLHESPRSITIPLIILSFFSIVAGFIGFPHALGESLGVHNWLDHYLNPVVPALEFHASVTEELLLMLIPTAIFIGIIFWTRNLYVKHNFIPVEDGKEKSEIVKVIRNKYYIDESYNQAITKPIDLFGSVNNEIVEPKFIDALIERIGKLITWLSIQAKYIQTGNLGYYLLIFVLGVIVFFALGIIFN